jgi:hypothetical protein
MIVSFVKDLFFGIMPRCMKISGAINDDPVKIRH